MDRISSIFVVLAKGADRSSYIATLERLQVNSQTRDRGVRGRGAKWYC